MKQLLCAMIGGLMLLPACAQQQRRDERNDKTVQNGQVTLSPPALPAATPSSDSATPAQASDESISGVDSALQTQIQDALNKDPVFNRDGVKVTATTDGIELSGDVASGRDRLNAGRIAQSYARGKRVVNHIVVKGHGAAPGPNPQENAPANTSGSAGAPESGNLSPPRSKQ